MFPQAEDLARYWANIRNCVDAITDVPESHWKLADYYDRDPQAPDRTYAHRGGFLTPVDFPLLDFGISPHSIDATDTTQLLGLLVARAALDDAGYPFDGELDRDRVSVILGVTGTLELVIPLGARLRTSHLAERAKAGGGRRAHLRRRRPAHRLVLRRLAGELVPRPPRQRRRRPDRQPPRLARHQLRRRRRLRSSLGALNLAMLELAANRCDLAVTGGLDAFNDIFMYMCFSKTPALSPSGDARPFDAQADGTVLGEGLGVVVLKRLEDARRDNDRIYAVIRSIGTSSDGKGQAVYAPSSAGQAIALRRAYQSAGISPGTVELVEAHGTGTRVGDGAELAALEEVYRGTQGGPAAGVRSGSVKSQVGHTKAAAGAAGMIKAALALHHKVLPPTTKVSRPIEPLASMDSPFYLNAQPRPWMTDPRHPRRAAVSAFGFGGSNFHCILEEAESEKPGIDWDGDVQIVALSADQSARVDRGVALSLKAAATGTRSGRRRPRADRGSSRLDAHRALLVARRGGTDSGHTRRSTRGTAWETAAGTAPPNPARFGLRQSRRATDSGRVFIGNGPPPGPLAMLFPGQGSQYVGMLRELACQFPQMQAALALVNQAAGQPTHRSPTGSIPARRSTRRHALLRKKPSATRESRRLRSERSASGRCGSWRSLAFAPISPGATASVS